MQLPTLSRQRHTGGSGLACAAAPMMRIRITAAGVAVASAALLAGTAMAGAAIAGTAGAGSAAAGGLTSAPTAPGPPGGPVPRGFTPVSMTFVSASEGWVLGTAPCTLKPCTSVVRTTDGGLSWVGIPAPRFPLDPSSWQRGLNYIRFASPLDGFAFGSQLWVTHDGGATWQHVPLPGRIGDLETSAGVVYAAVMTKNRAVTIYASLASGGPWIPVRGLPANVPGYAALGTITLHGTAAWIILGNRLYATQASRSWARDPVKCAPGYGMASAGASSTRQVTLLCVSDPAMGSAAKILYSSSDGGARFSRTGTPPLGGDHLDLLAQPTAKHIFIATSSAATWLDVSGNGGRTWAETLRIPDGGLGWSDFGFTTPSQGVAIEGNPAAGSHMYMTRDAGQAWHQIKF